MAKEKWKTIPIIPKYEASTLGRIRNIRTQRILKFSNIRRGYKIFKAYYPDGSCRNMTVHKAVGTTFVGNPQKLPQINHKDGDKSNNKADNIEWCTCAGNIKHAFKTGLRPKKYRIKYRAKITPTMVRRIKMALLTGMRQNEVVNIFKVSKSTVEGIQNGSRWSKITLTILLNE